jgi:peroxiredoxin
MTTTDPSIATQVAAFTVDLRAHAPADVLGAFKGEQAALIAAGLPEGIPAPGAPMPDGRLLDVRGDVTSLAEQRRGRPAVVVFYRGAWCPYCNIALRTYQRDLVPALAELDVALIAVSPQKPDGSLSTSEANDLTYSVVSDSGGGIAAALGILISPSDEVRAAQAALGVDVAAGNVDGTPAVPMPTTVLVDADGTIRWIDVHPDYTTRTEPEQILDAVRTLTTG